jgi:anti-sigma28 factor (negative regulator of flagellin synthesis)
MAWSTDPAQDRGGEADIPRMRHDRRFDLTRIQRLREALRQGQYRIDAGRIADRLIAEARRAPIRSLRPPGSR